MRETVTREVYAPTPTAATHSFFHKITIFLPQAGAFNIGSHSGVIHKVWLSDVGAGVILVSAMQNLAAWPEGQKFFP